MCCFEEACRLLDTGDYAGARDAYRKALLAGSAPVSDYVLTNLGIAEERERLEFRLALSSRCPDAVDLQIELVHSFLKMHIAHKAIQLCTELLDQHAHVVSVARQARFARLAATSQASSPPDREQFVDDFVCLWNEVDGSSERGREAGRFALLTFVVKLANSKLIDCLREIQSRCGQSKDLHEIINNKINELAVLDRVPKRGRRNAEGDII